MGVNWTCGGGAPVQKRMRGAEEGGGKVRRMEGSPGPGPEKLKALKAERETRRGTRERRG